ncbi:MAG: hypothetical protein JO047_05600, partial [Alphaproteobacteria bacterium]|nr:hypothetical protein [Alphaproteobacteria bacterium]
MTLLQFTAHHRATPGFAHAFPTIGGKPFAAAGKTIRTWMKRRAERA